MRLQIMISEDIYSKNDRVIVELPRTTSMTTSRYFTGTVVEKLDAERIIMLDDKDVHKIPIERIVAYATDIERVGSFGASELDKYRLPSKDADVNVVIDQEEQ